MRDYEEFHWKTLETVRRYLFERIHGPIQIAIEQVYQAPDTTVQHLKSTQLMLNAWAVLIRWKQDPTSIQEEFENLDLQDLPAWIKDNIEKKLSLKFEQNKTIYVNRHSFYEAMLMLLRIAEMTGELSHIIVSDATSPREGVWLRVVFQPPQNKQYQSKLAIMDNLSESHGDTIPIQFAILADLFELNRTRFSLQNNTRTGQQAFAVLVPETALVENEATSVLASAPEQPPATKTAPAINKAENTESKATTSDASEKRGKTAQKALSATPPSSDASGPEKDQAEKELTPRTRAELIASMGNNEESPPNEMATSPTPAVSLQEKADEIDRTEDILHQIQDIMLDYMGTTDLVNKAAEIIMKIYALLRSEATKSPQSEKDRVALNQLYTILNVTPKRLENDLQEPTADLARDMLSSLQKLLSQNDKPLHGDNKDSKRPVNVIPISKTEASSAADSNNTHPPKTSSRGGQ